MTRRDPWVNMLRTTIATLAAGVGGADAVTVLPFDHAARPAGRVRPPHRPQHLHDPHRGVAPVPGDRSGGRLLVRGAADRRTRPRRLGVLPVDRAGRRSGRRPALGPSARPARRDLGGAQRRSSPTRREPITGVSEFPHLAETPGGARRRRPRRRPADCRGYGGTRRSRRCGPARTPISPRTGARPRVYLAALGPAAAHTARARPSPPTSSRPAASSRSRTGTLRGQRGHRGLPVLQRHAVRGAGRRAPPGP